MIRCLYLGEKKIGENLFKTLCTKKNNNFKVVAAISNGPNDHNWWGSALIQNKAQKEGIPFSAVEDMKSADLKEIILQHNVNLIISVQSRLVISQECLDLVNGKAFNLHLAKLPEYKGFYAINHALLERKKNYFVTIHWIVKELDAGDIAYEASTPIEANETAQSLYSKANQLGEDLFGVFLNDVVNKVDIPKTKQVGEGRYFNRKSLDHLREIKDINNLDEVGLKSRAFYFPGFPPAYVKVSNKKIGIVPFE